MNFKQVLEEELYLEERTPPKGKKYIALFDIDETLLTGEGIFIWKKNTKTGKEIPLSTEDFAKENIVEEEKNGFTYDMREFRTPEIVKKSIERGKPIWKNVKLLNDHIRNGWSVGVITARGLEDIIYKSINKWTMFQKDKGLLERYGKVFVKNLVHAVNDNAKVYTGANSFEKKANLIRKYAAKYDKVKFVDDDEKNLRAVKALGLDNVVAVKAWPKEE